MARWAMARKLPPVNWLRTFEAAARHLSFTAAARELGVTQAAVSQQMRLLELQLGRALFHRLPRALAMTEAGEALLPLVSDSLERLTAGIGEIFGQGGRNRVLLRATTGFAVLWLAPRLPAFRTRHPDIELRITTANWPTDVPEGDLDLEIRTGAGAWSGVEAHRLSQDAVFPVCSPALQRGRTRLRHPADLARHTLLHAIGFRDNWAQWLAHAGVADRVEAFGGLEFDTSVMALDLAARGAGVALGRTSFVAGLMAEGRLVAPFDIELRTEEAFYLLGPARTGQSAAVETFRAWLLAEAADFAHGEPVSPRRRSGLRQGGRR